MDSHLVHSPYGFWGNWGVHVLAFPNNNYLEIEAVLPSKTWIGYWSRMPPSVYHDVTPLISHWTGWKRTGEHEETSSDHLVLIQLIQNGGGQQVCLCRRHNLRILWDVILGNIISKTRISWYHYQRVQKQDSLRFFKKLANEILYNLLSTLRFYTFPLSLIRRSRFHSFPHLLLMDVPYTHRRMGTLWLGGGGGRGVDLPEILHR